MAEPVFATVAELMAFVLDQPDELEKASSGGGGIVDAHEAALNFIEGTFSQGLRNQLQTDLGRLADNVRPGNVRSSIDNFLMPQFANSIGSVAKNPGVQYRDLFDYFETNSESLNSRDFTFAPIPAFTGTGDGTLTALVPTARARAVISAVTNGGDTMRPLLPTPAILWLPHSARRTSRTVAEIAETVSTAGRV